MKPSFRVSLVAAALAALPFAADAAGLGKLNVMSGLGQPLKAEVDITATRDELAGMSAKLAPSEAFRQAGIDFAPALAGVKFSIGQKPNGQPVIKLTSDRPINEPFLDMLIELNWSAGRLVREYTFLLDPPEAVAARPPEAPAPVVAPQTKPAAAPARPAAPPAASASAAATAAPAASGERTVKSGDTLGRIAAEVKPDGVSLDQMLVALYRSNEAAFIGNNINRLRSGRILQIPDKDAVAAIDQQDARRTVVAQSADFNAYRRKLAEAAAAAPAAAQEPGAQAAAGKITPKVEDKAAPAEAKDQLKVSKGEAPKDSKAAGAPDKAAQNRIAALEEDVLARDKALKESTARLTELERNIKELQKLVEAKNQTLADMQKQAEAAKAAQAAKPSAPPAAPEPPKAVEAKPAPVEAPKAPEPVAAAPAPEPKAEAKPAAEPKPEAAPAPAAEAKPAPKPAPEKKPAPPVEEPSFLSSLFDSPGALAGGGGALALLLGYVAYKLRQRRKDEAPPPLSTTAPSMTAPSVFGSTGGQSVDTSGSSIQTDFSQGGMAAIDADEGVDPVAEADVYMAYGRDAQAEEILLDALKNEPTRHAIHVKLLEIYAQRKNLKQFETLASELYAQTGGQGGEWDKAAALGRKLDPQNPLYGSAREEKAETVPTPAAAGAALAAAGVAAAAPAAAGLKDTWAMPGEFGKLSTGTGKDGELELDLDLGPPSVSPAMSPAPSAAPAPTSLDVDLGLEAAAAAAAAPVSDKTEFMGGLGRLVSDDAPAVATEAVPHVEDLERTEVGVSMLDFNLDIGREPVQAPVVDLEKTEITADALDFELAPAPSGASDNAVIDLDRTDISSETLDAFAPDAGGAATDSLSVVDLERTDVGGKALDFNMETTAGTSPAQPPVVDLERTDITSSILDFGLESSVMSMNVGATAVPPPAPTIDLSGIDLSLPAADLSPASDDSVEFSEVDTKIELARAYDEMGDREGARELLQEVVREGSSAQQQRAQDMLARLG